jgi:hypothetical protein
VTAIVAASWTMLLRRRTRHVAVAGLVAVMCVAVASCQRTPPGGSITLSQPDPVTRSTLEALSDSQRRQAGSLSAEYVAGLVREHPQLAGLTVTALIPVYDEATPLPVGVMARLSLPSVVPVVTMSLVRSRRGEPEPIESMITNLRGLDVIVLLSSGQVINVGVTPQAGDALVPATATRVRPIDPEQHRDPAFGDDD